MSTVDVAILGSGWGGLAAALCLADAGYSVRLYEQLKYPGGCASTFERGGHRFESGATLLTGLGDGEPLQGWIDRFGLEVPTRLLDPVLELRTPYGPLEVGPSRERLIADLLALGEPPGVRAFFEHAHRLATPLWELFREPSLLPPLSGSALARHALSAPAKLRLVPWLGRSLGDLARHHGAWTPRVQTLLDALCQITVQTCAEEAEASFAVGALEAFFRGSGHVQGGLGVMADALAGAIRARGGLVSLADRVQRLERTPSGWTVQARSGSVQARAVVANLLPDVVRGLSGESSRRLEALEAALGASWSAAMLFLVIEESGLPGAHHLQLVGDPSRPLLEGNLVLGSVAPPDPRAAGLRSVTVSTHVRADAEDPGAYADRVHEAMRATVALRAPELRIQASFTASPRTFARFTGRPGGRVGGVPRTRGLHNYAGLWPRPVLPGLFLVGDSLFPGQSTLATLTGGHRVAEAVSRALGR